MRWLLRLYPPDFRDLRAGEVEAFVRHELRVARGPRAIVVARIVWDLVAGAWRLRRHRRRRASGRGGGWAMDLWGDARLVMRGLGRSTGFTFLVVTTLALGVGLNTALFSVVRGVLLRPLDFPDAGRLVYLEAGQRKEQLKDVLVSGGTWRSLREGVPALEAVEAIATIRQNLGGAGLPRQVQVGWVSPGFLVMLGAGAEVGRLFRRDDPPGTAVLSHTLWMEAFGGDPGVVGRSVRLDGHPYTIVGILPAGFRLVLPAQGPGPTTVDIWKNPDRLWQNGDVWNAQGPEFGLLRLVGRLERGASLAEAQIQVDEVVADLVARDGRYRTAGFDVRVHDLHAKIVEGVRPSLLLLSGAVGLVLLIACANVANLLAVRAQGRRRDLAVRVALGSPRFRLARLVLLESLALAVGGGLVGLAIPTAFVRGLGRLAPPGLPRVADVRMDGLVIGYAAAAALLTTLLMGVAPIVHAWRSDPSRVLGNGRESRGGGRGLRDGLVVGQVALSLVLVVGAGLLTESLVRLQAVKPGFDPSNLFTFGVSIPGAKYGWPEEAGRFYRSVEARAAALPGVEGAGIVWPLPLSGTWGADVEVGEGAPRSLGVVPYYLATEAYFPTARIPLKDGRLFRDGDRAEVVVISEDVARRAFPGRRAVGRTLRANPWGPGLRDFEVIGVVGDVRAHSLREPPSGAVYFDARSWSWVDWEVHVVVRTAEAPATLVPELREAVASLDPTVPVAHPTTVSRLLDDQAKPTRFLLLLLGVFGASAGTLAAVGLYGVVSYAVGLRRREFGIRIALGARDASLEQMVLRRGLELAIVGVGLGAVGAILLSGVLESVLYGVSPRDPEAMVLSSAGLVMVAAVASWIPARRAARTSPSEALRSE